MSADVDTKIITQEFAVFTGIKKLNYAYAIGSLNLDYILVCAGWQEQRVMLTNSRYIPTSFIPVRISDQFDSKYANLRSFRGRYLLRNLSGNISQWNLFSISLARYMLASYWYIFIELWLSTSEALYGIGVLVTVADGSRCNKSGVVSARCGLDVKEGSCMLLWNNVLQQRK